MPFLSIIPVSRPTRLTVPVSNMIQVDKREITDLSFFYIVLFAELTMSCNCIKNKSFFICTGCIVCASNISALTIGQFSRVFNTVEHNRYAFRIWLSFCLKDLEFFFQLIQNIFRVEVCAFDRISIMNTTGKPVRLFCCFVIHNMHRSTTRTKIIPSVHCTSDNTLCVFDAMHISQNVCII